MISEKRFLVTDCCNFGQNISTVDDYSIMYLCIKVSFTLISYSPNNILHKNCTFNWDSSSGRQDRSKNADPLNNNSTFLLQLSDAKMAEKLLCRYLGTWVGR